MHEILTEELGMSKEVGETVYDIPINHGLLEEKTETSSNFTVAVFLHYFIISLMHEKVWISPKNVRSRSYFSF